MFGIYKIINLITKLFYIGSTSAKFNIRWNRHRLELRNNIHKNPYFQNAWNKYKEENFKFEIIEVILIKDKKYILEREQYWIDETKCYEKEIGYNMSPTAGSCLGVKMSEKTKQKISVKLKGRVFSKEHRENLSISLKGKYVGEDNFRYGKPRSEETKRKISESNKGKKRSVEEIEKMRERSTGKHLSEESKEKLSIHFKGKYAGEKNNQAKLTQQYVDEIRQKYIPRKHTYSMLAKEYNVSYSCIQNIINGKHWKENKEDIGIKEDNV